MGLGGVRMSLRVGLDHYSIAHRRLSPEQSLAFARNHGFDGVQFLQPTAIDPQLDHGKLASFRQEADEQGLYLEIGLPSPNPIRRARELGCAVSASRHSQAFQADLEAVAALGCRHARVYVGDRHDRFRSDITWPDQLAATLEVLRLLTPALLELHLSMAIETHADLTTSELLDLLDRLDSRAFGVTLDTGNLLMRLDCPLEAVEKLAPRVLLTHIKDAVLAFTPRGLCWQARPVGFGILPMQEMLSSLIRVRPDLPLTIELHPRVYDLPIFDREWLSYFPNLLPSSLAAVVRLAALCESRYAEGTLPRPETVEEIPWARRDLDWLARSLIFLRSMDSVAAKV